jgi:uncharacterized membrane protein YfhO
MALGLPDKPSTAELMELSPERIVVVGELDASGWLVLGEWDYPGWKARVDGRPSEIYRAYYGLRAVPLAAGVHTVEFLFRPASLYVGAALSSLALLVTAVGMVVLLIRRGES